MLMPREFYIPKGATKIADKHSSAVAYLYANRNAQPCATVFGGKRSKPDASYRFRSDEEREKFVQQAFANIQAREQYRAEQREKRKQSGRGLEVGDVVSASWGYEQTNVDFYIVTALIGSKMVELRECGSKSIAATGWASDTVCADTDNVFGEPFRRLARDGGVKIDDVRYAFKWDGRPQHRSWYG